MMTVTTKPPAGAPIRAQALPPLNQDPGDGAVRGPACPDDAPSNQVHSTVDTLPAL